MSCEFPGALWRCRHYTAFLLPEDMQLSVRWISGKKNLPYYLSMLNMRNRGIVRAFSITESTHSRSGSPFSPRIIFSPHLPAAISNLNFNSTPTVRAHTLLKFQVPQSGIARIYPPRRQPALPRVQETVQ